MPKAFNTFQVKATLPEELNRLTDLAFNLYWTWNHEAIELFHRLDRDLWDLTNHNPIKMLGKIKQERFNQIIQDDGFMAHLDRAYNQLQQYMNGSTWFASKYGKVDAPAIAYFSMEYGLSECLPIYSGGLGILAGDHMKSASELGLPLVGIGLMYQQGYFQQYLNADGWQQETYPDNDFYNLPIKLEVDQEGSPIVVQVQFPGRVVSCYVWRVQVGRVALLLLDTNTPENSYDDRKITYQLYGGNQETRIQQELILGIGGMLALRKLGYHVKVCHMNEGHAGFMSFERIRHRKEKDGLSTEEATEIVKSGTIFTTHTPVPAGIDIFQLSTVNKYIHNLSQLSDIDNEFFVSFGRENPNDHREPLNMALMALRTTAYANGVSRLHGEVSKKMWHFIWPNIPEEEVPIGYVTNGIHTNSWISKEMSELLLRYLGPDWHRKPADQSIWDRVERIPDVELWRVHERRRERLVAFTRRRLVEQLKRRGASAKELDDAMETLNPEALTIGFARRFATYKRATLLLKDLNRLKKILGNHMMPVQFIFAGKAHPKDNAGKEFIKELIHFARQNDVRKHFVFLENYDISIARYLVQGVDVWLNNPQRPMEASGTSGMKVIPNGGLNFSVLDGWWCEGYDTDTGWAIGAGEQYHDPEYQDEVESKDLYDVLENEIMPLFYDLGSDGLPRGWIAKMKASMTKLSPVFSTNRMVQEYTEKFYLRAIDNWQKLSADNFAKTKTLVQWKQIIRDNWHDVKIVKTFQEKGKAKVGMSMKVDAEVHLGALKPEDVVVQIYSGPLDGDYNIVESVIENMKCVETLEDANYRYEGHIPCNESGQFGYSVRVLPDHPDMIDHFGLEMMHWIGEFQGGRSHHTAEALKVPSEEFVS
ncbi:alpha-glucan phosphorylase [candidate division LCP-89 bacterium B3_LCP]|uniref:Alpha-glucan phosphorylase n=1 Tax=candidate division LCP-89 bacterium B3_LCP TaxID=2012998 RepID=A0A532UZ11_UNCL8|nr:MAG: alpha-glucan phosphorylase [candidate division LCP-89 bacterium B3_LCP]